MILEIGDFVWNKLCVMCRWGTASLGRGFMCVLSTWCLQGAPRSSVWGRSRMMNWKRKLRKMVRKLAPKDNLRALNQVSWWKVLHWRLSPPFPMTWSTISKEDISFCTACLFAQLFFGSSLPVVRLFDEQFWMHDFLNTIIWSILFGF